MEYTIGTDPEFLRVSADMIAAGRSLMVRNFRDVEQAKDWLRTR